MNQWYIDGPEKLLARQIPEAALPYAVGVNEDYVFDETHNTLTPMDPYILLPKQELINPTYTGGLLEAENTIWIEAAKGVIDRSLILTGVIILFSDGTTDWLMALIDSATIGLPQTLTGVDVTAHWDARGILLI